MGDLNITVIDPKKAGFQDNRIWPEFAELQLPDPDVPPIPANPILPRRQSIDPFIEGMQSAIQATPDPEETTARIKNTIPLAEMLKINEKYAYGRQTEILEQYTGKKTSSKNWQEYLTENWQARKIYGEMSKIAMKMMSESDPEKRDILYEEVKKLEATMPSPDRAGQAMPVRVVGEVMSFIQQHVSDDALRKSLTMAAAWAIAEGTAAFVGGLAIPLPEEIVTVPAAMAHGAGHGLAAGMTWQIGELEAGGQYLDLIALGIDHKFAKAAAVGTGVSNMLLESMQIGEWLKTIPGAEKVLSKGVKAVTKGLASDGWKKLIKKTPIGTITKMATKNAWFAAKETAEEVAQEATAIVYQELAIYFHNRAIQGDKIASKISEALPRMWEIARRTYAPFFLLGVPGATITALTEKGVAGKEDIPLQKIKTGPTLDALEKKLGRKPTLVDELEYGAVPEAVKPKVSPGESVALERLDSGQGKATDLIKLVEQHKDTKGGLKRGLDFFRTAAETLPNAEIEKAIDWTRNQSRYIHRFLGGDLNSILIARGRKPAQQQIEGQQAPQQEEVSKEVHDYAKALKNRAIKEYEGAKKEGLVARIQAQGKINLRHLRGTEEASDIPKALRTQIFTTNESAMDIDDMAASLGMSEEELRQGLINYKDEKPSSRIEDYYEGARWEMTEGLAGEAERYKTAEEFIKAQKDKGITLENLDELSKKDYAVREGESNYYGISEDGRESVLQGEQGGGGISQPSLFEFEERHKQASRSPLKLSYKKKGYFKFPKAKISSPADVAFAFRELKNSAVERLFIVGTKDNIPISVEPASVGAIDQSLAVPYETLDLLLAKKADGFYIIHNHPSRHVSPSNEDLEVTRKYEKVYGIHGVRFKGHIIIDETQFGHITPSHDTEKLDMPKSRPIPTQVRGWEKEYQESKVPQYHKYIEWLQGDLKRIRNAIDIVGIMKGMEGDFINNTLILYLNNQMQVLGSEVTPHKEVTTRNISAVAVKLRAQAVIFGNSGLTGVELLGLKDELKKYPISLLDDVTMTDMASGLYKSQKEEGVMEKGAEYGADDLEGKLAGIWAEAHKEGTPKENVAATAVKHGASPEGVNLATAYEALKDPWIGEEDVRAMQRGNESERLLEGLKEALGYKRAVKYVKDVDEAIHLAIDINNNPGDVAKYWDKLTDRQKELINLSQNLPIGAMVILDKIQALYEQTGVWALEEDVIRNLMDNYASRIWDLKGEEIVSIRRKFGTKSRHKHPRVFDTIVEGWAAGYDLKVGSAIMNLNIYKQEITNTILDKQFLKAMLRVRDVDGKPLLTTSTNLAKELGYKQVVHPNFKTWAWAATTDVDAISKIVRRIAKEQRKVEKTTADGGVVDSKPIERLKTIITESLQMRGFTEGEATNAIVRVEKAVGGDEGAVENTIETIEKMVIEREQIIGYNFIPVYGRHSFLTPEGALIEESELWAPKKIAQNLNNMLGQSVLLREEAGKIADVAKFVTKYNFIIKSMILQSSFFHHQAGLRSYFLPGIGELNLKDLRVGKAIQEGIRSIRDETPEIMMGVRNGLTLGRQQEWDAQLVHDKNTLDKFLDKIGPAKVVRDKVMALKEAHTAFLFGTWMPGLKAKRYLIEFREQLKKFPNEDPNVLAKRVANLMNDDFGGLHLKRLGRNPTWNHILQFFLLAPDWTLSNVRTMVKTINAGSKEERAMYQRFWAGAIIKGAAVTTALNYALAGGDVDEMKKRFEIAWASGGVGKKTEAGKVWGSISSLKWMAVDITPIYEAFGADIDERKYWYLIGHFRDVFKFVVAPLRSVKHKGSVATTVIQEAITGTDWAGRRFTTMGELFDTGETVAWGKQNNLFWEWFPSYILSQTIGFTPVAFQNLLAFIMGEVHGLDAILNSAGFGVTTISEKRLKEIRKEMRR